MAVDTTLYDRLGIKPEATLAAIKKAHRAAAKKCHPDLHPEDPQAKEKFRAIQEAFDILSDVEKRARYDREGMPKEGPVEVPREVQVRALFRQVMTQILSQVQDPVYVNPMVLWAEHYATKKNEITMILRKIEGDIVKYRRILDRSSFSGTEGEENIFAQICKNTMESAEAAKIKMTEEYKTLEDMNFLASKYTYRVEVPQQPTVQFQSIHMFRGTMGATATNG